MTRANETEFVEPGGSAAAAGAPGRRGARPGGFWAYLKREYPLYLMVLPGVVLLFIFTYVPMYGITLAFKNYNPRYGIFGSEWVGLLNFTTVFSDSSVWTYIGNTLIYGAFGLIFSFPASIILALLMNELRCKAFKSAFQTVSYLPYFLSWAIVGTMVYSLFNHNFGIVNQMLEAFGAPTVSWYNEPKYWRAIIVITSIWKTVGWGTIVYLAALTGISPELYEAAEIDGANRWQQVWHIAVSGLMPTICITFILNVSSVVRDSYEIVYALVGENAILYPTTEVVGSWVYRMLMGASGMSSYGYASAVTLLQSTLAMILMFGANWLVRKMGNQGIF